MGWNAAMPRWLNCCFFLSSCLFFFPLLPLGLSDTSVLDLIIHLEILCHFNVVTLFSPYCIEEINRWSAAICIHARTDLHKLSITCTYTHTGKNDMWINQTRKIQHVLQLWDSYWFLVHRLIDFAFLRLQIDGGSRGFWWGWTLMFVLLSQRALVCFVLS